MAVKVYFETCITEDIEKADGYVDEVKWTRVFSFCDDDLFVLRWLKFFFFLMGNRYIKLGEKDRMEALANSIHVTEDDGTTANEKEFSRLIRNGDIKLSDDLTYFAYIDVIETE